MKDEKGRPMTYWGGLEPTDPYERGFIDGMAKQRESSVDKWVNATAPQTKPLSNEGIHELANEHLRTQNQDGHLVVLGMEDFARAIEEAHGIK